MARTLSSGAVAALNAQETGEVFIVLLTIDHVDLAAPIRVSSDAVDTVSNAETYIAFPFELSLPTDLEDGPPRARLRIDNVDRQVVQAIRQINSPASVLIEIVRGADPDTVEASFPDFELREVSYSALFVEGDLVVEQFSAEPFPAKSFTPGDFPALY